MAKVPGASLARPPFLRVNPPYGSYFITTLGL